MILTDETILKEIERGNIYIQPFHHSRLGSNSYDLTLGRELIMYHDGSEWETKPLDCKKPPEGTGVTMDNNGYTLYPGNLYLGYTNEYTAAHTTVPMIEGKSSIGRLGIRIHATAGFGDIGFAGHWTLEIDVVVPVIIYPNMPIAQIYFNDVSGKCLNPYHKKQDAKYSKQEARPVPSAMWKNFQKGPELKSYTALGELEQMRKFDSMSTGKMQSTVPNESNVPQQQTFDEGKEYNASRLIN